MKKFYDDFYELVLYKYVISLYETNESGETLTIHVIHDDESYLELDKKEWYCWRAGLPTVRFINVNDINFYPHSENIKFFTVSGVNKTSEKVPFDSGTFKEDLWKAIKTI